MYIDWKAVSTVIAAFVVGGFALLTALLVTKTIEKMKLDAQATLERERMEFQKEAEMQKQRMELYKILYQERILAVKRLAEATSNINNKLVVHFTSDKKTKVDSIDEQLNIAMQSSSSSEWIFTQEVTNALRDFYLNASAYIDTPILDVHRERREQFIDTMSKAFQDLDIAMLAMMRNSDLSQLVTIPRDLLPEGTCSTITTSSLH